MSEKAAAAEMTLVSATPPKSTSTVLTTLSLARKPPTRAVATRQSLKPRGWNIGATTDAMCPNMLSDWSSTILKLKEKLCKNHITMVAQKMTVNALCKKSRAFSHNSRRVVRIPGIR